MSFMIASDTGSESIIDPQCIIDLKHVRSWAKTVTCLCLFGAPPIDRGERGGSVVECRTPEREVQGSRPTAAVLCP